MSPIKYNPKDAVQVIPAGQYQATLEKVAETVSKNNNEMHELRFRIYGPNDRQIVLTDRIVYPAFTWKLKRLAQAFGEEAAFNGGYFNPESVVNHNLVLELEVKDWDGGEQNQVKAYIKPLVASKAQPVHAAAPNESAAPDDDLPF